MIKFMSKRIVTIALISLFASCKDENTSDNDTPVNNLPVPQPITVSIDAVYPHDTSAFTQGLQFFNGKLYEGTGEINESTLRIVDPKTGKIEKKYLIPDTTIFGEGITIFNNKIYQLTWQNKKIFEYKLADIMQPVKTFSWQLEGWGITNDGKSLIISDGSDKLYYVLPDSATNTMQQQKVLSVADNTGALDKLNELEFIDGYIYANRWFTDDILKIDPNNGHVVGKINLTGLLQQYVPNAKFEEGSVLNGIAYNSSTKKLYITGKRWPKMFEIRINQ
jgi:glutamine cyclotransferase